MISMTTNRFMLILKTHTIIKTFIVKFLNELCFLTKFTSTYTILMQINMIHVLMFHVVLNYLHLYLHFLP